MIGYVRFRCPVVVHLCQGSEGVGHKAVVGGKEQFFFRFLQRVAVGVGVIEPSSVAVAGIVVVAVFQAFHHLGRDAQRAPTGEEVLQKFAVVSDFKCCFHSTLIIVCYIFPSQFKRIVIAVIDAAVAPLAAFYLGGVADGFAGAQRLHVAVVIGQRDAVLLDTGYFDVAKPAEGQPVQLCLKIFFLVFPPALAADRPRRMSVPRMKHDRPIDGIGFLIETLHECAFLTNTCFGVLEYPLSMHQPFVELTLVTLSLGGESITREDTVTFGSVIFHLTVIDPITTDIYNVPVLPYQCPILAFAKRLRKCQVLGSARVAFPIFGFREVAVFPMLFTKSLRLGAMHSEVAVVRLKPFEAPVPHVDAVAIGEPDGDVRMRLVNVFVVFVGSVASASLHDARSIHEREGERQAVRVRLGDVVRLHLHFALPLASVPFDGRRLFSENQFKSYLPVPKEHGNRFVALRMMDAEHAMQVEDGLVRTRVDPCLLDKRAVGEVVASFGGVCRTVDAGVAQMETALEAVAVGVSHLAFADGSGQFLTDGVAKLPASNVDGCVVVHDMSFFV